MADARSRARPAHWLHSGHPASPGLSGARAEDWPAIEHHSHWNAVARWSTCANTQRAQGLVEAACSCTPGGSTCTTRVQVYMPEEKRFMVLDEEVGKKLLGR